MCAINGFNFRNKKLIERMNALTKHRGPDGSGVYVEDSISLGHNRLSIIDPRRVADQPMLSDHGRFVLVFNGEIYNFKDIRKELTGFYRFMTESDSEVILASYSKWGSACVERFNGIFTLAIWDREKEELFLARDPLGVKPLYYYWDGKRFIFSSEIKGILEHDIVRTVNAEALNHYLRLLYVPAPLSLFESIYKFPHGYTALLRGRELSFHRFAGFKHREEPLEKPEAARLLRRTVEEAVIRQTIADKPLGIYLSGGIDSNVVLAALATKTNAPIETFSVGFRLSTPEAEKKFNADFELARRSAAFYHTHHHEVFLDYDEVPDLLARAIWHMDEPIGIPTALSMLKLGGFAKREGIDVALGGNGGDELFGGYERYRKSLAASYFSRLPAPLRSLASLHRVGRALNTPAGVPRFERFMFQNKHELPGVLNEHFSRPFATRELFAARFFKRAARDFEAHLMDVDRMTWMPDESLTLADKMSMASGLELRVPILDLEVLRLALRIPRAQKVSLFETKIILKEAFEDVLPPFLLKEPKRGWFSPGSSWLRHPRLRELTFEALSPSFHPGVHGVFDYGQLRRYLVEHLSGKSYHLNLIWPVLVFQLWARRYNVRA